MRKLRVKRSDSGFTTYMYKLLVKECLKIIIVRVMMRWQLIIDIGQYWALFLVSVISERCNWYCSKCTSIVISCDYSIINCFYDTHNHWESARFHWKNQKPVGRFVYHLIGIDWSNYRFTRILVKSLIGVWLVTRSINL